MKKKLKKMYLYTIVKIYNFIWSEYLTVVKRPQKKNINSNMYFEKNDHSDTVLIMQGPLSEKGNFTFETLKIYTSIFPSLKIVLSTWNDEKKSMLHEIEKLGITIIRNIKPVNSGQQNINYQIASSMSGIEMAKKQNFKYCIKTRTDQRFLNVQSLSYLKSLLKTFPPLNLNQNSRLIILSQNTFKYRLFSISDMFMFGYIDDMSKYWNADFNLFPYDKNIEAESNICLNFLRRIDYQCEKTLENYWAAIKDNFCVIDQTSIDIYWNKYESIYEYRRKKYDFSYSDEELYFADWIQIYNGNYIYDSKYEAIPKLKFGARIVNDLIN